VAGTLGLCWGSICTGADADVPKETNPVRSRRNRKGRIRQVDSRSASEAPTLRPVLAPLGRTKLAGEGGNGRSEKCLVSGRAYGALQPAYPDTEGPVLWSAGSKRMSGPVQPEGPAKVCKGGRTGRSATRTRTTVSGRVRSCPLSGGRPVQWPLLTLCRQHGRGIAVFSGFAFRPHRLLPSGAKRQIFTTRV